MDEHAQDFRQEIINAGLLGAIAGFGARAGADLAKQELSNFEQYIIDACLGFIGGVFSCIIAEFVHSPPAAAFIGGFLWAFAAEEFGGISIPAEPSSSIHRSILQFSVVQGS